MKALALLADSFRETLDRKSFLVFSGLSGLLIVFFAGISFRKVDEREAMSSIVGNFNLVFRASGRVWAKRYDKAAFEISDFTAGDGYRLTLQASPPEEIQRLIRHWQGIRMGQCKEESDPIPDAEVAVDPDLQKRFLEARFREGFVPDVEVEAAGPLRWTVKVRASGSRALAGAEEMSLFFGAVQWRPRLPGPVPSARRYISSADFVALAEIALGEVLMGLLGILVAIVATAGSVPRMLEKGTLDLLLARPLERSLLLGVKYFGGCLQVLLGSALLIGGCWLALSARTGHWNFSFLLTILTLTFFFAVLYSVSVLVGVITRSWSASAFSTIATWVVCFGVGKAREHFASPDGVGAPAGMVTAVRFLHLLLPKTWDLGLLNQQLIARGQLGDAARSLPEWLPAMPLATVFVTSALFAVVMISMACTRFSKQDY